MTIGEAQKIYREQRAAIVEQRKTLVKQRDELTKKCSTVSAEEGKRMYANGAATLELSIDALNEKFDENQKILDLLGNQYMAVWNAEAARQQSDTMGEYAADLAKIMEVARRIGDGAKVPPQDEQKLMEYSMEMYMSAKNLAMLKERKEKYESLWDDEKDKAAEEYDPQGKAENAQACVDPPETVDVAAGGDGMAVETAQPEL